MRTATRPSAPPRNRCLPGWPPRRRFGPARGHRAPEFDESAMSPRVSVTRAFRSPISARMRCDYQSSGHAGSERPAVVLRRGHWHRRARLCACGCHAGAPSTAPACEVGTPLLVDGVPVMPLPVPEAAGSRTSVIAALALSLPQSRIAAAGSTSACSTGPPHNTTRPPLAYHEAARSGAGISRQSAASPFITSGPSAPSCRGSRWPIATSAWRLISALPLGCGVNRGGKSMSPHGFIFPRST